jgi:hypothetical protein
VRSVQPGVPLEFTLHTTRKEAMRFREDNWRSLPEDFHWHFEYAPDGGPPQGGGGIAMNLPPPEDVAKILRDAARG